MSWSWNKRIHRTAEVRVQNLKMRVSLLVLPVALLVAALGGGCGRIIGFHWG
jgi:hypothetical protein